MIYDVIVIGAGASGLFALANLDADLKVLCLEKNASAGKKLLLTGGGKCNLTSNEDIKKMLHSYEPMPFVRKVLYAFNNKKLIEWFENAGLPCHSVGKKIFPKSDSAKSVLDILLRQVELKGHEIRYLHDVVKMDSSFEDVIKLKARKLDVDGNALAVEEFCCRNVIIAVGGRAFSKTGSDGQFLNNNFTVNEFEPSLVPIYVKEKYFEALSGVSVRDVKLTSHDKKVFEGDLLFAGRYLSGPVILNFSARIRSKDLVDRRFYIDFLPDFHREHLFELLCGNLQTKALFRNLLMEKVDLPDRLLEVLLHKNQIWDKKASELSKKSIHALVEDLKGLELHILKKADFNIAMSSVGGISTEDVNALDMSLKSDSRIKILGEALDLAIFTGGYNLQFAFSSAFSAIRNINFKKEV